MTVKELITILIKEVKPADREIAEIEIWHGEQEYNIKSMSGFGLLSDIVIKIEPINSLIMRPAKFKKEHTQMVKNKLNEIKKANAKSS